MREFTFNEFKHKIYRVKKMITNVGWKEDGGVVIHQEGHDRYAYPGRTIYPEFLEYCYTIEGCPKKLLLYIVFHHLDDSNNRFLYNAQVIHDFNSYNKLKTGGKPYSTQTVKDARDKLVEMNIILNIKRYEYMMNPAFIGGENLLAKARLIREYTSLLIEKGKDPMTCFYPL